MRGGGDNSVLSATSYNVYNVTISVYNVADMGRWSVAIDLPPPLELQKKVFYMYY